jgi:hypothetical protein
MTRGHGKALLISACASLLLSGCGAFRPPTTGTVLLGESFASGSEAVVEVNNAVANAERAGCKAISVGGYAAGAAVEVGGGLVIGVPVLVKCPQGTVLLPDGNPAP